MTLFLNKVVSSIVQIILFVLIPLIYVSFNPETGGEYNGGSIAASIPACKEEVNDSSMVGRTNLYDTEKIVPGKKNVLAMFYYSNNEEMSISDFGGATKNYVHTKALSKYDAVIALTMQFN